MSQNQDTKSAKFPLEVLIETSSIIKDLDSIINDRLSDLKGLQTLTRAILDNTPPNEVIREHIAKLASSSREAYIGLRKTRDRLMELQGQEDDRSLSRSDLLTGLPNSTGLMSALTEHRDRENQALIIVEMAGIRVVAEKLGVKVARRVIVRAATLIRQTIKERDMVARIGPDSFAILLQNVAHGKGTAVAVRIFDVLSQRLSPSGANIIDALILSIGFTLRLSPAEDAETFLTRAHSAVSEARTLTSPRMAVM